MNSEMLEYCLLYKKQLRQLIWVKNVTYVGE